MSINVSSLILEDIWGKRTKYIAVAWEPIIVGVLYVRWYRTFLMSSPASGRGMEEHNPKNIGYYKQNIRQNTNSMGGGT